MATNTELNIFVRAVEWAMRHVPRFFEFLRRRQAASAVDTEIHFAVQSVDFYSYEDLPAPQQLPAVQGVDVPRVEGNVAFNLVYELMEAHPGVLMRLAGIQTHWAWGQLFELLVRARFRLHHQRTGQYVLRATLYSDGSVDVTYRQRLRVSIERRPAAEGCIAWYCFSRDQ